MSYTVEDKYKFLLSLFKVCDISRWEKDAMFCYDGPAGDFYFQFWQEEELFDMDKVLEAVMQHVHWKQRNVA